MKTQHSHEEALMKIDTHRLEQELKTLKEHVAQSQKDEVRKASEVERMFMAAREAIEKDRQDKYLLLVEQNKLKHKAEKMTESLKSYQVLFLYSASILRHIHQLIALRISASFGIQVTA